jgi:hypothetical protein
MNKLTHLLQFERQLFDKQDAARKSNEIIKGILQAQSPTRE